MKKDDKRRLLCDGCGYPMMLLLTSWVCDACDGKAVPEYVDPDDEITTPIRKSPFQD